MKKTKSVCVVRECPSKQSISEKENEMFFREIMALGEIEICS